MNDRPFFSILLPTRNRSAVVGKAIASVLNQSFQNFELIISDNDEDRSATKSRVADFSDNRIKYHQTDHSLSMPENWQFALSKSRGKYITVLQDKQVLFPDALSSIHSAIVKNGSPEVLTWKVAKSFQINGVEWTSAAQGTGRVWFEESKTIIEQYTTMGSAHVWSRLPRMINSCVSRSLVSALDKDDESHRFFVDVTPDLSASFIQLAQTSHVWHLDKVLVVATAHRLGGGLAVRKRTSSGKEFVNSIRDDRGCCRFVAVRNPSIVSNLIVDDFRNIRKEFGGNLEPFDFSDFHYARELVFDFAKNVADGNVHADRFFDTLKFARTLEMQDQMRLAGYFLSTTVRRVLSKAKSRARRTLKPRMTGALVRVDDLIGL